MKGAKRDYSTWLTKQQVADAIGVSTKTVEKLADQKKLQQAYWRRPETGAKIVVYHPADVDRIRKERNPDAQPFVVPPVAAAAAAGAGQSTTADLARVPAGNVVERLFHALANSAESGSQNSQTHQVRVAERLFLKIPEASAYSGLPQAHLRTLIGEGKLTALKTGAGWRIRRTDLEKL